eukprot:gene4404-6229_t
MNLMYMKKQTTSLRLSMVNKIYSKSTNGPSFYETLGSPKFVSAPMVDQSSLSWRLLVKQNGVDLAYSQMMHARNFMIDKNYRHDCIDWDNYNHTSGRMEETLQAKTLDQPLIVQLAGDDPDVLVKAGGYIQHDVAAIDLNLGCPQKIAKRGNYGAYLLKDQTRIVKLLSTMVKELKCPITAKIRVFDNDDDTLRLCHAIQECGISMLAVHGRTVKASKLFVGEVNWNIIKKIKQELSIPIIANGGISSKKDALDCLEYTQADGVMSSEALLENPKLFSKQENSDYLFHNDFVRYQLQTVNEYLDILSSYPLPRPLNQVVRGHLFKMLFRFLESPYHHDLRDILAKGNYEQMRSVVYSLQDRMQTTVQLDTEKALSMGYISNRTWYMRHRDEKASNRILSIPKNRKILVNNNNDDNKNDDALNKLSLLKEKLLSKQNLNK